MEMLALVFGGLLVWWIVSAHQDRKNLASQVMVKWVETAQIAAASAETGKGAALVGRSITMSGFQYEYGGVPPMLKVSVSGTGKHLGFRGDIMDDGSAMVWAEDGSRPAARKLVKTLCVMYPDLIDGNKFSARMKDFVDRFASK
ncbi:hypothetical protein [Bradyrhizobium diazoefficiens]|uniref:hypothetical protein n=1 Tax=Bradyrhizobium diazoefficiens TaxID=1355477 RepID=UPI001B46D072|nr:hypothetical protein [Bradyrhizobium japonicum]